MTDSRIQQNVMRRVRTIHLVRPLVSTTALSFVLLLGTLWGIGREVWVARVFENMPKDVGALLQFAVSAFTHTEFLVQALSVIALFAFIWMLRDAFKSLRYGMQLT